MNFIIIGILYEFRGDVEILAFFKLLLLFQLGVQVIIDSFGKALFGGYARNDGAGQRWMSV